MFPTAVNNVFLPRQLLLISNARYNDVNADDVEPSSFVVDIVSAAVADIGSAAVADTDPSA